MKVLKSFCIVFLFILFFCSCKKPKENTPAPAPPPSNPSAMPCATLSAPPAGFYFKDSTINANQNIKAFFYNPLKDNEIIYVAEGDGFGYNKLYAYSILTKKTIYLGNCWNYLPQVNKQGWIVFSSADFNIYKIKTNGDSLTQLTFNHLCHNPQWDYTGKKMYYFQSAFNAQPAQFIQASTNGNPENSLPAELSVLTMCKKKNGMAHLKHTGGYVSVYYTDITANSETLIFTMKSVSASSPELTFGNLTFDNNDENLYWNTNEGIYTYNLETKQITQRLKNCETLIYTCPMTSFDSDEISYSCHIIKQLDYITLFHAYKTFQINTKTQAIKEFKVF